MTVRELTNAVEYAHLVSQGNVVIEFYSPSCRHCRDAIVPYAELATLYAAQLNFARIDLTTGEGAALFAREGGVRYPTFVFYLQPNLRTSMVEGMSHVEPELRRRGFYPPPSASVGNSTYPLMEGRGQEISEGNLVR